MKEIKAKQRDSLCMENNIPIVVFNFFETGSIENVVKGKDIGTIVAA